MHIQDLEKSTEVHQERDGSDELRQEVIEEGHVHGQLRQEAIDDELP